MITQSLFLIIGFLRLSQVFEYREWTNPILKVNLILATPL